MRLVPAGGHSVPENESQIFFNFQDLCRGFQRTMKEGVGVCIVPSHLPRLRDEEKSPMGMWCPVVAEIGRAGLEKNVLAIIGPRWRRSRLPALAFATAMRSRNSGSGMFANPCAVALCFFVMLISARVAGDSVPG